MGRKLVVFIPFFSLRLFKHLRFYSSKDARLCVAARVSSDRASVESTADMPIFCCFALVKQGRRSTNYELQPLFYQKQHQGKGERSDRRAIVNCVVALTVHSNGLSLEG